jgi:DNA-binding GntR family transcriptional regulator
MVSELSTNRKNNMRGKTAEFIYDVLKLGILNGKYSRGERITEESVAKTFSVSRGSVRSALQRLKDEGLLIGEPFGGVRVREISLKEAIDVINIRLMLEKYAITQVILSVNNDLIRTLEGIIVAMEGAVRNGEFDLYSNLNTKFHEEIYRASGNDVVANLLIQIKTKIMRTQYKIAFIPKRAEQSLIEHKQILEALRLKDLAKADKAVEDHLKNLLKTTIDYRELLEIKEVNND